MFSDRKLALALRRAALTARCAGQRAAVAAACRRWEEPARLIDRGMAAVRAVRAHPALVGAAVLVAAVLGRRKLVRWAGRGLVTWRTWRGLLMWIRRLRA